MSVPWPLYSGDGVVVPDDVEVVAPRRRAGGVEAGAAFEHVVASVALQVVGADAADQVVVAGAAVERVHAGTAVDVVVARVAVDLVVAGFRRRWRRHWWWR